MSVAADPLVSVVMPAYNCAEQLPGALESIRLQAYESLEVILVDDGSNDETGEVARASDLNLIYIRQANAGPAAARNRGIRGASGSVVAFLDADDRWPPGKLRLQVDRLVADPELELVTGRIEYVLEHSGQLQSIRFPNEDKTVSFVQLGAAVCRRRTFQRIGLFDETMRFGEDIDWYMRLREAGLPMVILKETTLRYRLHESNMTNDARGAQRGMRLALKKSLDRRRSKTGVARNLESWSSHDEAAR